MTEMLTAPEPAGLTAEEKRARLAERGAAAATA